MSRLSWLRRKLSKWQTDQDANGNSINNVLSMLLSDTNDNIKIEKDGSGNLRIYNDTDNSTMALLDENINRGHVLGQVGSAIWSNRTHEGFETLDTATTYTIGSGQDYSTLKAAADDLRGLILGADLTLKLSENVTESNEVEFKELTSYGGRLYIELNGYTWTYDGGSTTNMGSITVMGPVFFYIKSQDNTGGTLSFNPSAVNPPYHLIANTDMARFRSARINTVTYDMNSKANRAIIDGNNFCDLMIDDNTTFSNTGSLTQGEISVREGTVAKEKINCSFHIDGGLLVDSGGNVQTS